MKSVQKLKDTEKELRYVVRYIKVSICFHRSFKYIVDTLTRLRPKTEKLCAPQHSAEAAVEESERIFSRLIRSIEKQSCEVKELIRVQERAAVSQTEELLEKIQREMVELRRADAELEKLSQTEDHIHFLQVRNKRELGP